MMYIYGLYDPITNELRYVGKTNNIKKRYNTHCSNISGNSYKENWIRSLKNIGLKPIMKTLLICEDKDVNDYEIKFIEYYKNICNLTNHSEGGTGGNNRVWTDAEKSKQSLAIGGVKHPMYGKFGKYHVKSVKVIQLDLNNNIIKYWDSIADIKRTLGYDTSYISKVLNNKRKQAYNCNWRYND